MNFLYLNLFLFIIQIKLTNGFILSRLDNSTFNQYKYYHRQSGDPQKPSNPIVLGKLIFIIVFYF